MKERDNMEEKVESKQRRFARISGVDTPPLVTVLVLCYKNTTYVRGMLKSIFGQDYPRIQLIVSDDGTEDFEPDELLEYINGERESNIEQVIVRKNEENLGTVRHVAQVLPLAEGEYLVLTAADDRYNDSAAISACVRRLIERPEAQWLVARTNLLTPDYQQSIGIMPSYQDLPYFEAEKAERLFSRWSRRSMALPCQMMFRSTAISQVGGIDLNYTYMEDWPLVLKLLRMGYAPVFLNRVISIHSTGGVTNSNERYGVETRKALYQDKQRLMNTEVLPYRDRLTPEDQKALEVYLREIMERNYFLDITCEEVSFRKKLKLALQVPRRLGWLVERKYLALAGKTDHKKWLTFIQHLLVSGAVLAVCGELLSQQIFSLLGWAEVFAGGVSGVGCIVSAMLKVYCHLKAEKRRKLVM